MGTAVTAEIREIGKWVVHVLDTTDYDGCADEEAAERLRSSLKEIKVSADVVLADLEKQG
jgi:hypothetical protein